MLVQHIVNFYNSLNSERALSQLDHDLLLQIREHFFSKAPDANLTKEDIQFLFKIYRERRDKTRRDPHQNYTLAANKVVEEWIRLSKDIATELKIPYLSILFYDLENTREGTLFPYMKDPADGSDLAQTTTLTNFYEGEYNLLYRKRVFYDRMYQNAYTLCTTKNKSGKELRVITVAELSYLKSCQQNIGAFSIESSTSATTEHFTSFWDFMVKKVFPRLTRSGGRISDKVLSDLVELVECYYHSKQNNLEFEEFKKAVSSFFERLYLYPLLKINCLYGQKVRYKNQPHYLLDVFISILDANEFIIEHEMEVLSQFLFNYNPNIKINTIELKPLYVQLKDQIKAYNQCCSLFISLYVYSFKTFFSGKSVDEWDIENTIPKELYSIHSALKWYLTNNNINYIKAFNDLSSEIAKNLEPNFFSRLTQNKFTIRWCQAVKAKQLDVIHGHWFDPEVILPVLNKYKIKGIEHQNRMNTFLDNVIQTLYNKKATSFKKNFRINVLLSQFLSKIEPQDKNNLLKLLGSFNVEEAKVHFLSNCEIYINKRLKSMGYIKPPLSSSGFSLYFIPVTPIDTSTNAKFQSTKINALVEQFKKLSFSHLKQSAVTDIQVYLGTLSYPILSLKKIRTIEAEERPTRDPIGAYT
jgi:hypothetical protein